MKKEKVILIIRDGYGRRNEPDFNAVIEGKTPYTDYLMEKYPTSLLRTSGEDVGLPSGYMGGSEVGHLTIGSGRVIPQSLLKINKSIEDESFFKNKAFLDVIKEVKKNNKTLHLMGLLQDKGVHSHQDHLFALLRLCKKQGFENVKIHVFCDGRDSPQRSVKKYIKKLEKVIKENVGVISSVIGRFYAMDRDTRYDRIEKAYNLLIKGRGEEFRNAIEAVDDAYSKGENDEFIKPRKIKGFKGINDGDGIICYNYRTDRVRQLTHALLDEKYDYFKREKRNVLFTAMTPYYENLNANVAFKENLEKNLLGDVIEKNNLKQLRISETEKYPHVTFFFNGLEDKAKKGEDRILIPSPRDVNTYDEKPEMSIYEVTEKLVENIKKEDYDLIVVNFVNGDMVGHTGKMDAAVKAVEAVDKCLEKTIKAGLEKGYTSLVFADHGNCEEMEGEHQTSHTLNDVDLILVSNNKDYKNCSLEYGGLKDVAVTTLNIMGLAVPKEMTGVNLIKRE